jgi:uncharacterized membrane protein
MRMEHQRTAIPGKASGSGGSTERIKALSDGVFAIAITLLVLDLKVPEISGHAGGDLASSLLAMSPRFLTYVLSFLVVGLYWMSHHRIFAYIERYDPLLLWLNLLFLLSVSFIPFPTAVLSEHQAQPVAVAFYAASLAVTGLVGTLIWVYASRGRRLVDQDIDPRLVTYTALRGVVNVLVFLLSIPVAFLSAELAMYSWLLIPVGLFALGRIYYAQQAEEDSQLAEGAP